jgi:hypothetical protein
MGTGRACRFGLAVLLGMVLAGSGCKRSTQPNAPKVAGESKAAGVPPEKALILSGKSTRVYHFVSCAYARDIPETELLGFANPDEAEQSGRLPCAACKPRERFREYGQGSPGSGAGSSDARSDP